MAKDRDGVGYGRPPKAHQFKPGQSGNPKGRPKGSKSHRTIIAEAFGRSITVEKNGRKQRITVAEAIARRLSTLGLKSEDPKVLLGIIQFMIQLTVAERDPDERDEPLEPDDQALLAEAAKRFRSDGRAAS